MREFFNIFKDVKSGALPSNEIPGFMLWAVGKRIWLALQRRLQHEPVACAESLTSGT